MPAMTMTPSPPGLGLSDRTLTEAEVRAVCARAIDAWNVDGKRLLVLMPDLTRTCPMGLMFRVLHDLLAHRVKTLNFMAALGTHLPLSRERMLERVELTEADHAAHYSRCRFLNHAWKDPAALMEIGTLSAAEVSDLTQGMFAQSVRITCNRALLDYDQLIICGPVFPHEVVGFSGGNKYIMPGIAGPEIIDFFHWVSAMITNRDTIGVKWTPVRTIVDRCAAMAPIERRALCMVVKGHDLAGLYAGTPEEAWSPAADLSARLHVEYRDRLYDTVFACCPPMYDDLWTGGKCMYKSEPIVAEGGRVIIYAPHITEVSRVHGKTLLDVGYHVRDYFRKQWPRFQHYPWGELAHSTHVKGSGTYENGVERPRADVILATGIPEDVCRRINLGYMNPATLDPAAYRDRESEGILFIPKAGEILYRPRPA